MTLVVVLGGCVGRPCSTSGDCLQGEACRDGTCRPRQDGEDAGGAAAADDAGIPPDGGVPPHDAGGAGGPADGGGPLHDAGADAGAAPQDDAGTETAADAGTDAGADGGPPDAGVPPRVDVVRTGTLEPLAPIRLQGAALSLTGGLSSTSPAPRATGQTFTLQSRNILRGGAAQ